jgi:hypothetical protein
MENKHFDMCGKQILRSAMEEHHFLIRYIQIVLLIFLVMQVIIYPMMVSVQDVHLEHIVPEQLL